MRMKMRITASAQTYANALVQTNMDKDKVLKNLETVSQILKSSNDLTLLLNNPTIPENLKSSIIDDVFGKDIEKEIVEFLKILINKKRFGEFDMIVEAFRKSLDEISGIKRVEVVSAVDLKEDFKQRITAKLAGNLNKTVRPIWSTDPEIIAGLVVKIEDDVIDTSVRNKLEKMKRQLL